MKPPWGMKKDDSFKKAPDPRKAEIAGAMHESPAAPPTTMSLRTSAHTGVAIPSVDGLREGQDPPLRFETEKSPNLSVEALCLRYLVSRLGGATGAPPVAEKATGASGSGRIKSRISVSPMIFSGTATGFYPLPLKNMPVACFRQRKNLPLS